MGKDGGKGKEGKRKETEGEREDREAEEELERERRLMQAGLGSSKSTRSAHKTRGEKEKSMRNREKGRHLKATARKSTKVKKRKVVNKYGETSKEKCFRLWDELEEMVDKERRKRMKKMGQKPKGGKERGENTTDTDSDSEVVFIGPEDSDFKFSGSETDSDNEGGAPPIWGGSNLPIVI
jgi:hypothetical protein